MRSLLAALLVSLPAAAQISGALTASGDGGGVHLALDVRCELACSPVTVSVADIEWRYAALDGGGGVFVTPVLDGGHFEFDSAAPQLGTALTFETSASCSCGAIDGGVIAVSSEPFPVLPVLQLPAVTTVSKGAVLIVDGFPQGAETIGLTISGAGADQSVTITHSGADFTGGHSTIVLRPTHAGDVTVAADLQPWGVTTTATMHVNDDPPVEEKPRGCTSAPELWVLAALTLFIRRRGLRA